MEAQSIIGYYFVDINGLFGCSYSIISRLWLELLTIIYQVAQKNRTIHQMRQVFP